MSEKGAPKVRHTRTSVLGNEFVAGRGAPKKKQRSLTETGKARGAKQGLSNLAGLEEEATAGKKREASSPLTPFYARISEALQTPADPDGSPNYRIAVDFENAVAARDDFRSMLDNIEDEGLSDSDKQKLAEMQADFESMGKIAREFLSAETSNAPDLTSVMDYISPLELESFYTMKHRIETNVNDFLGDYARTQDQKTIDNILSGSPESKIPTFSEEKGFKLNGRNFSESGAFAGEINAALRADPTKERFNNVLGVVSELSENGRADIGATILMDALKVKKETPALKDINVNEATLTKIRGHLTEAGYLKS